MAKETTMSLMYAKEPKGPAEQAVQRREPQENFPEVPTDLPVRSRLRGFRRPSEPQAEYSLHRDDVWTLMAATGPPVDRASDLRSLSAQQELLQFARSRLAGQRGGAGFRPGPVPIQAIQV
jgi:hypothetical protein